MGRLSELRASLGRDDIQLRFGAGRQFVTMDDKTVELDANASPEDIAQALSVSKVDAAVAALPVVVATSEPANLIDTAPSSNITGLQSGMFHDALAEMRKRFSDRQKQAVGKIIGAVDAGTAQMDAAAQDVATKVEKEISAAIQEFAQLSNGGPG